MIEHIEPWLVIVLASVLWGAVLIGALVERAQRVHEANVSERITSAHSHGRGDEHPEDDEPDNGADDDEDPHGDRLGLRHVHRATVSLPPKVS